MLHQNSLAALIPAFMLAGLAACGNSGRSNNSVADNGYRIEAAVNSGQLTAPTDLAFVPGSSAAFIVTEQAGYAVYFNGGRDAANRIDLRDAASGGIGVVAGGEQGLLNVEFHPDYATNGYVFFYHTSVADTVNSITRMTVAFNAAGQLELSNPQRIVDFRKADSAVASNHNGGGLVFAPDGTLLASVGDGGANSGTAQVNARLLGKVVRILPSLASGSGGYLIPAGNMFDPGYPPCSGIAVSTQPCPEILAMGLRNPFRMACDGDLIYLGDVGNATEEINSFPYTVSSANFGWPTHDGYVSGSGLPGYRNPIVHYTRSGATANAFRSEDPMGSASGAASVMIGDVYRGTRYTPALNGGALLFGDFYDGFIRAVGVDGNGTITDPDGVPGFHLVHATAISSMVRGPDDYLYFTALYGPATVYRLVRP
jgi:glucose/arabinose dehydrogenase